MNNYQCPSVRFRKRTVSGYWQSRKLSGMVAVNGSFSWYADERSTHGENARHGKHRKAA